MAKYIITIIIVAGLLSTNVKPTFALFEHISLGEQCFDTIPDSIIVAHYLKWIDSADYIEWGDVNQNAISDLEKDKDTLFLMGFLSNFIDSLPLYWYAYPNTQPENLPSSFLQFLFKTDINNDNLPDVIYHGPTGGTPLLTQIYINTEKGFIKVFSGIQHIIDFEWIDNTLHSFTLFNPGCCLDPQILTHYYSLAITENRISYMIDSTLGYLSATEKPDIILSKAQSFKTKSASSKLRNECYELDRDGLMIRPWHFHGNIITEYSKGSNGKCIGSKTVNEEEWVFVIMDELTNLDTCYFSLFREQPTMIKGWMLKSDTDL